MKFRHVDIEAPRKGRQPIENTAVERNLILRDSEALPKVPGLFGAEARESTEPPHHHSGGLAFGCDSLLRRSRLEPARGQPPELLLHRCPSSVAEPAHVALNLVGKLRPEPQTAAPQHRFGELPQVSVTGTNREPQWKRVLSNELADPAVGAASLH